MQPMHQLQCNSSAERLQPCLGQLGSIAKHYDIKTLCELPAAV